MREFLKRRSRLGRCLPVGNRGSIPILIALCLAIAITLFSARQQITGIYSAQGLGQSLMLKTGKRGNSSALNLLNDLLASRTIQYVPWTNADVQWSANPPFTDLWAFVTNTGDPNYIPSLPLPQLVLKGCNPRKYSGAVPIELFGLGVLPGTVACSSTSTDLSPSIGLGQISFKSVFNLAGGNTIDVRSIAYVPTSAGIGTSGMPVVDNAKIRIDAAPPIPQCSATLSPAAIVQGQPATFSVTTSLDTFTSPAGNYPAPNASLISTMQDDTGPTGTQIKIAGGTQSITVHPLASASPLGAVTTAKYFASLNGPGGPSSCFATITVYPVPHCRIVANPPAVTVSTTTTLYMYTSDIEPPFSPVKNGTVAGVSVNPYANPPNPVPVTPPRTGVNTYYGQVTGGINGATASCKVDIPVYAKPVCTAWASPWLITQYDTTTLSMVTNYGGSMATQNPITKALLNGTPVWPTGGSVVVEDDNPGWSTYWGQVWGVNGPGVWGNNYGACPANVYAKPTCPFNNPRYGVPFGTPWGVITLTRYYHGPSQIFPPPAKQDEFLNAWYYNGDWGPCPANALCIWAFTHERADYSNPLPWLNSVNVIIGPKNDPACTFIAPPYFRNSGCFAPETRLRMANGELKRADQIHERDWLWNPVRQAPLRVRKVVAGPEKIPMVEIGYEDRRVHVTSKHPVPTPFGVKQAKDITLKDSILGEDGAYHRVRSARRLPVERGQVVWNFEVESGSQDPADHFLLSDGIVTGDLNLQKALEKKARPLP